MRPGQGTPRRALPPVAGWPALALSGLLLPAMIGPAAAAEGDGSGAAPHYGVSLTGEAGDAERGKAIVLDPDRGNCIICHTVPGAPQVRFQGDVGPPLSGVGRRLSSATLRVRIVDSSLLNPESVMPPYHRTTGLSRVDPERRGQPVLSAAEVEDVIAYLQTLR